MTDETTINDLKKEIEIGISHHMINPALGKQLLIMIDRITTEESEVKKLNKSDVSGSLPLEEIINTGWIHLEQATLRVHVINADKIPIQEMEDDENKPDFVLYVGRSADPEQTKQSILVQVTDGYDLNKLSEWLKGFWRQ